MGLELAAIDQQAVRARLALEVTVNDPIVVAAVFVGQLDQGCVAAGDKLGDQSNVALGVSSDGVDRGI